MLHVTATHPDGSAACSCGWDGTFASELHAFDEATDHRRAARDLPPLAPGFRLAEPTPAGEEQPDPTAGRTWYLVGGGRCEIVSIVRGDDPARAEILARVEEDQPEGRWLLVPAVTESAARDTARAARRLQRAAADFERAHPAAAR